MLGTAKLPCLSHKWKERDGDLSEDSVLPGFLQSIHRFVCASKAGHVDLPWAPLILWLTSTSLYSFETGSFYKDQASFVLTILSDSRVLG